jgi:hypothetical protein
VVANDFGVIDMDAASVGDVWNSGEAMTVTLIDQDLNKNSASDEDLVIKNTTRTHLIPSLQIGSPLSILDTHGDIESVSSYSKIAYFTNSSLGGIGGTGQNITIYTGYTGAQLDAIDTVNTYFNWDFTSFGNSTTSAADNIVSEVCLFKSTVDIVCSSNSDATLHGDTVSGVEAKGIVEIDSPSGHTGELRVNVTMSKANGGGTTTEFTSLPIIADIFSFGDNGVNNAIYRILLEETDDNSATFVGSVEYTMLTQLNINSDTLYSGLETIDQDIDVIVEQDMTDEDSLRVNYYDKGADGVFTQIADQVEAPTHDGVVSFDLDNSRLVILLLLL